MPAAKTAPAAAAAAPAKKAAPAAVKKGTPAPKAAQNPREAAAKGVTHQEVEQLKSVNKAHAVEITKLKAERTSLRPSLP